MKTRPTFATPPTRIAAMRLLEPERAAWLKTHCARFNYDFDDALQDAFLFEGAPDFKTWKNAMASRLRNNQGRLDGNPHAPPRSMACGLEKVGVTQAGGDPLNLLLLNEILHKIEGTLNQLEVWEEAKISGLSERRIRQKRAAARRQPGLFDDDLGGVAA